MAISQTERAIDVLLVIAEWPLRALVRAQLLEDGLEVVAFDTWPVPREYFQPGGKPRAVVIDLHGLDAADQALAEMPALAAPGSVVVITSLANIPVDELRRRGLHVLARPVSVGEIAAATRRVLTR